MDMATKEANVLRLPILMPESIGPALAGIGLLLSGIALPLCLTFVPGCSQDKVPSDADIPARRAARGERIPTIITCRENPLCVKPIPGLEQCVTDRQLCDALCSAMPFWHPPTVPSLLHEMRLWGTESHFSEEMVGRDRTGDFTLKTLLSDSLCKENTPPADSNYLIDSPFGVYVVRNGTVDSAAYRGEGHYGQLLMVLAESGVPTSTPVSTASGRTGTVKDLLQDAIMRYSPTVEQEFIAIGLALYLPPVRTEIVPSVVEIENGGSSGPGGVAWTAFNQERRNRHEEKVQQTRWCPQGFPEGTAEEAS
jgi:hypothetical protein